jgi:hypothetical protein
MSCYAPLVVDAAGNETTAPSPDLIELHEPSSEPPQPSRRSRPLSIALAVLAAIVIVLGTITGPTLVRIFQQKDATLELPERVSSGGAELKRDDSPVAKEHASDLVAILRAQIIDLDGSVGAVYNTPSGDAAHSIMIVGGTTMFWNPEGELDTVLRFISESSDDPLKDLAAVDPGPLAGTMKCGTTEMDNAPMAICGWADHGSIAIALFPGRSTSEATGLLRDLRAASLKR